MEEKQEERIIEFKNNLLTELENINNVNELNLIKSKYLGKNGIVTDLTRNMRDLTNEERIIQGTYATNARNIVNQLLEEKGLEINNSILNEKLKRETIDITLPSKKIKRGSKHPFNRVIEEIEDLFVSMGYDVIDGPELETDENCFVRLNVPEGHPARDNQDSFYINKEYLLRTQTSTAQARAMQDNVDKGPIRIICPGKTYRRDDDATHSHQFGQVEGLVIEEGVTLADLKGTLEIFAKKMLGDKTEVRFRPSYFPFTEPSFEVDVTCFKCHGAGCSLCKKTGWIEVFAAGMVHPNVLRMGGYDPEKYQGFAFGPGLDRIAMFKYAIPDIRYLYTNDIRFLEQFDRKDDEYEIKY